MITSCEIIFRDWKKKDPAALEGFLESFICVMAFLAKHDPFGEAFLDIFSVIYL